MSEVCEMFGVGPVEALRTIVYDEPLVTAIAEYRAAKRAHELFNAKGKAEQEQAFRELDANPGLTRILAQMHRAQMGAPVDGAAEHLEREGMQIGEAMRPKEAEERDGIDAG